MSHGVTNPVVKQLPPVAALPAAAADRALGNGPAGAAFRVHPAKKSYCQKAPCGSEGAFVASVPPNMRNPEPVAASTIPVLAEGPPSGLLSIEQNAFFEGPSLPQAQLSSCANYMIRQQIGTMIDVNRPFQTIQPGFNRHTWYGGSDRSFQLPQLRFRSRAGNYQPEIDHLHDSAGVGVAE